MTVILINLADENHDLQVNWWTWRPTLALIQTFQIIDDERIEMMGCNGTGVQISESEACAIGDAIQSQVIAKLQPEERVLLDLSTTTQPKDYTFYNGEVKSHSRVSD